MKEFMFVYIMLEIKPWKTGYSSDFLIFLNFLNIKFSISRNKAKTKPTWVLLVNQNIVSVVHLQKTSRHPHWQMVMQNLFQLY